MSVPSGAVFFRGLSLALRSRDQFPASHWSSFPPQNKNTFGPPKLFFLPPKKQKRKKWTLTTKFFVRPPPNFIVDPSKKMLDCKKKWPPPHLQNLCWTFFIFFFDCQKTHFRPPNKKMVDPFQQKLNLPLRFFSLPGNYDTICIGRDIQCIPYAGFFYILNLKNLFTLLRLSQRVSEILVSEDFKVSETLPLSR